jgi:hypothetical protein
MGAWHILNDIRSDQLHQQSHVQNNQMSWFTKIIIYVGFCMAVVILFQCFKLSCNLLSKFKSSVARQNQRPVKELIQPHQNNLNTVL